jgi:hypothetical protein
MLSTQAGTAITRLATRTSQERDQMQPHLREMAHSGQASALGCTATLDGVTPAGGPREVNASVQHLCTNRETRVTAHNACARIDPRYDPHPNRAFTVVSALLARAVVASLVDLNALDAWVKDTPGVLVTLATGPPQAHSAQCEPTTALTDPHLCTA